MRTRSTESAEQPATVLDPMGVKAALVDILAGRAATTLTGEEWELAVEKAGGCEAISGLRQRGFLDRWNRQVGFAAKTLIVADAGLRHELFDGAGAITRPVVFEWSRENLGIKRTYRFWERDQAATADPSLLEEQTYSGATLAGRELIRRLADKIAASTDEHGVATSIWAFCLRHPNGRHVVYAELPVLPFDPDEMTWQWIEAEAIGDDEAELIALEGETADSVWRIRWFLGGGQVRVRLTLDRARVALLDLAA